MSAVGRVFMISRAALQGNVPAAPPLFVCFGASPAGLKAGAVRQATAQRLPAAEH